MEIFDGFLVNRLKLNLFTQLFERCWFVTFKILIKYLKIIYMDRNRAQMKERPSRKFITNEI